MLEAVALGGNGLHDYRLGEWVCEWDWLSGDDHPAVPGCGLSRC